jgi:hypothetical protein
MRAFERRQLDATDISYQAGTSVRALYPKRHHENLPNKAVKGPDEAGENRRSQDTFLPESGIEFEDCSLGK